MTSYRNVIEANVVEGSVPSISVTGIGNLIVRNRVTNGGASPYSIVAGNDYGVIVTTTAAFSSSEPFANFIY